VRTILVTPRSLTANGHPSLDVFQKAGYEVIFSKPGGQPTEAELLRLLPGCVGYLAGVEPISATVLDAAKALRVIGRNGTGVDNIDMVAALKNGICVCRADGANARGVAELTIGLMLSLVRTIPASDRALKDQQWQRSKGIELQGRTLGVIGCGQIGRIVAQLAIALGMRVLAHDVQPNRDFMPGGSFRYTGLDELLAGSDVITLHCPLSAGPPLINRASIAMMRHGAYLIDTARAGLMDDAAVLQALGNGQLAGVAIDVFNEEPPQDWDLTRHPNVIATPHIGGFTEEGVDRAVSTAVKNMIAALNEMERV
jgi:D-3-phosphoglycerate dehydrogenase / 2-oxoglutarate reductase